MDQSQSLRLNKVFNHISQLQDNMDVEKAQKWRQIQGIFDNIERQMQENCEQKSQKFSILSEKVKLIMVNLQNQREDQEKFEQTISKEITRTHKNCQSQIDKIKHQREEVDQKLYHRLVHQLDVVKNDGHQQQNSVQEQKEYLKNLNENEIPQLIDEIHYERKSRHEIDQKIYQQFIEQINELQETFELEKRQREAREEELIVILKAIYQKIQQGVKQAQEDRKQNENMLVQLIENVITKVRKELVENDQL